MEQREMFGVYAQCTGIVVAYTFQPHSVGLHGLFSAIPQWSKRPQHSGEVHVHLDEESEELLPELARLAMAGFVTTDPGYCVPRWVKDHFQDYQAACDIKPEY